MDGVVVHHDGKGNTDGECTMMERGTWMVWWCTTMGRGIQMVSAL